MSLKRHLFAVALASCVAASVLPLWVARHLPAVDVPQHLFLIHVLGNLDDPALPYQQVYQARPGLTYLTFYYSVRALSPLMGEEAALKVWLTLILGAIPLSLLVLLRALGRSKWLALLACPLILTDNFYWGLVSFQSSLPLTFLVMGCFALALSEPAGTRRSRWALAGTAASLLLLQLTHAAGMIFPALALPLLLATTPSDWKRRARAVGALVPGVALFLAWLLVGVGQGRKLGAPGEPWAASAPLLSRENFVFHPFAERAGKFVELLSNGFWAYADRPSTYAVAAVAAFAVGLALWKRHPGQLTPLARARPALLLALGLAYYLLLPADISGYMYYIYPRYAQVAALLGLVALPMPAGRAYKVVAALAAAVAIYTGANHARLFRQFDLEASAFEKLMPHLPPNARVMHLITDYGSGVATHAVYLHYAALAALRVDGIPSFSLATDPSFPVGYRAGAAPPASPWEWRPTEYDWATAGSYYDAYLTRGDAPPAWLFRGHQDEVEVSAFAGPWRLFARKGARQGGEPLQPGHPSE